ncbi:MAG: hypothetical protein ACRDZX_09830, partial [Acidimicrobiales bacterium]
HLLVYGHGDEVGESYRGLGEIRWLLYWPEAPFWPEGPAAGDALCAAAVAYLEGTGVRRISADGALPAPGVYGLPEQWPHLHALFRRAASSLLGGPRPSSWATWRRWPGQRRHLEAYGWQGPSG